MSTDDSTIRPNPRTKSEMQRDAEAVSPPIDGWPKDKWGNPIKTTTKTHLDLPQRGRAE